MRWSLLLGLVAVAPSVAAQDQPAGASGLPKGWTARADRNAAVATVKFVSMGNGFHVTTGPAVILYNPANAATGKFHTLATFTQTKAPTHPEAYGLIVGGAGLDGEAQKYVYFLVRGDGSYLIKKRDGAATSDIVAWTPSDAVVKADAAGKATNKLEVDGKASSDKVTFSVNGKVVHTMAPDAIDLTGVIGFRVNHNLDVHIDGFDVHRK